MREKGFASILLFLIAIVGLGSGLYFVSQKTNLLSQAFSGKDTSNMSADSPDNSQLSAPNIPANFTNGRFISAFQILSQRRASQSPTPTLSPKKTSTPSPTAQGAIPTASPTPTSSPIPTSSPTPVVVIAKPKPICSVLVLPSSSGIAPYQADVCVGNNSNPYQTVQQELVDYDGNGSWDYQGASYGCHAYTFQNPGTITPKAKIISTLGTESDTCQTTATILAATPTPTPIPMPQAASSCSSVLVEGNVTYYATYTDQDGSPFSVYYINSGGTAKLTALTNPPGAYVHWVNAGTSMYLPNGGTLTPDPNNYAVVTFTAPYNSSSEAQGIYVRGDYSEYPNPWKHCPSVDFAVRPG